MEYHFLQDSEEWKHKFLTLFFLKIIHTSQQKTKSYILFLGLYHNMIYLMENC